MKKTLLILVCLMFVSVESLYAQPLKKHTFEIGPEVSYRTYKEPSLMKEEGWMYGVVGSYTYHNRLMLKLEGRANWGEVDYSSPISGKIDNIDDYMLEGRGLVGYDFLIAQVHSITPYGGVGYRYLNDDGSGKISTTRARFYERESNYLYSPLGMEVNVQLQDRFYVRELMEFDYFWRGWQKTHLSDLMPGLNDPTNTQKSGYGLRGSIGLLIVTDKIDFEVGPFIIYWNVKKSDKEAITLYGTPTDVFLVEPKNKATEIGFKITARF
jgi:hypothetical protein